MPPITKLDLITDAYLEAGIFEAGEVLSAEDADFGSRKLDRLLDAWNSDKQNIYATDFLRYTLVPNTQPLLIGQASVITRAELTSGIGLYTAKNSYRTGQRIDVAGCTTSALNFTNGLVTGATPSNFQVQLTLPDVASEAEDAKAVFTGGDIPNFATVGPRPTKILNANIILNNVSPEVKVPLYIADDDWWAANPVPKVTSTLPNVLYYSANWPNGQIFLWSMQSQAYGLELETWVNLTEVGDFTYPFYLPQGYRDAVTYSLAESLGPSYDVPMATIQLLAEAARRARAKIQTLNSSSPRIMTRDSGIPGGGRGGGYLNWLNGSVVGGK